MIIGVTGSFGSGKSTVAALLAKKTRFALLDADKIAKRVLKTRARKSVQGAFGTTERRKLAGFVFNDNRKLELLNSVIHPFVKKEIEEAVEKKRNVIVDAPLIVETCLMGMDALIIVKARKKDQLKRLKKKGFLKEVALKRLSHQLTFCEKMERAEKVAKRIFVVKNEKKEDLEKQIDCIIKKLAI